MLHMPLRRHVRRVFVVACTLAVFAATTVAQFQPLNGIRPADLRAHAIVGATVVPAPGARIENATIVIRDGVIEACGAGVTPPPDARRWDATGLTVYAGFIDAAVLVPTEALPESPARHWNAKIHPELRMAEQPALDGKIRSGLRDLGFTTAAVYPSSGIFRGRGTVIALAERPEHVLAYAADTAQAASFERSGNWSRPSTPGSLMGSIALARQTLMDAQWYAEASDVYDRHPAGNEPPPPADAFAALGDVIAGQRPVLFDTSDELNALRSARLADEFGIDAVMLGSGMEFRRLDEIAALDVPFIVPLRFPDRPNVSSLAETDAVTLRTMMTWEQAPTNPRRLVEAGVTRSRSPRNVSTEPIGVPGRGPHRDPSTGSTRMTPCSRRSRWSRRRLLGLGDVLGTLEPGQASRTWSSSTVELFEQEGGGSRRVDRRAPPRDQRRRLGPHGARVRGHRLQTDDGHAHRRSISTRARPSIGRSSGTGTGKSRQGEAGDRFIEDRVAAIVVDATVPSWSGGLRASRRHRCRAASFHWRRLSLPDGRAFTFELLTGRGRGGSAGRVGHTRSRAGDGRGPEAGPSCGAWTVDRRRSTSTWTPAAARSRSASRSTTKADDGAGPVGTSRTPFGGKDRDLETAVDVRREHGDDARVPVRRPRRRADRRRRELSLVGDEITGTDDG